jgi:hypothetical protein
MRQIVQNNIRFKKKSLKDLVFHKRKTRAAKDLKIRPLFGPFWENPAQIRLRIFPAAHFFLLGRF